MLTMSNKGAIMQKKSSNSKWKHRRKKIFHLEQDEDNIVVQEKLKVLHIRILQRTLWRSK
jgi:hypothetical protein